MNELLQDAVSRQAELRPQALAIIGENESLKYGELERQSNRLAHQLCAAGCSPGDRVCLFLPKSPAAIVSMLGVLKAGCVYVPIDLASPAARAAHVVQSSQPKAVLAVETSARLLDEVLATVSVPDVIVGTLAEGHFAGRSFSTLFHGGDVWRQAEHPPECITTPDDPAHILFTSGSTGIPKGVIIQHRNVLAFVDWAREYFQIQPGDRCSGHPPLHFDLSTFDIFGTLSAGAELHLVPSTASLVPHKLADFIRRTQLTQWFSVPSLLTFLARYDAIAPGDFPSLKRLLWCGEVLPTPTLIHCMQRLPHVAFTNLYGPTEATIASSYYTVPACPTDPRAEIPIGTACPGEELLVLDEKLAPVADGEIGDLYIRGVGLSPGYWRDEEKTAAAFLPNPMLPGDRLYKTGDLAKRGADGLFYFLGRADSQIKSRGYRIELGEIESAFHSLDCLKECAIVAVATDGFEGSLICCAFVAQSDQETAPAQLRQHVSKVLPSYMLPMRWKQLDVLPKNPNGKIDRPRLRELFAHDAALRD